MRKTALISLLGLLTTINILAQNSAWTTGNGVLYNNSLFPKIGINTATPERAFHVNCEMLLSSDKRFFIGRQGSNQTYMSMLSNQQYAMNAIDFSGNLFFRRCDAASLNTKGAILGLQSDGTVTIGVYENYEKKVVNTMGHALMVNGGILAEKVKIIADVPNSDHVFEEKYKLMPLGELKKYVEQNKHLPEIPSAQEFKDNGYNVGEMDDLLLRKVEELTLYMIQLSEENAALKSKITELEKQR
jgi:hypothetical protein